MDLIDHTATHGNLSRRAVRGAAALGVRQVLTYCANILGGIVLARLLSPAEFGFYAVIGILLAFLSVFGGTGFAGNLIRIPDEPTCETYRAIFTAQQLVVGIICIIIWFTAPRISRLYHIQVHGVLFFRLTAASIVLTSLMVIPQVKMERHLAFDKLALIEVCQAISFNTVAIIIAWGNGGILVFAVGLVARSTVGAILTNLFSPWAVGFRWDPQALKTHIKFGITLQGGQILAILKDSITPIFVGMYMGPAQMGYATWAMTFACYPTILLSPMQRLYLPFFARLQDDRVALARFVHHALWIANVIVAPLVVLSVVFSRPITTIIFGSKWLVALPLFYCFSVINISSATVAPLLGLLNALGKTHLAFLVIFFAMISLWLFGVPLIMYFGLFGFGVAVIGSSLTNLFLYWVVWRESGVLPWRSYWPAWPIALSIGILLLAIQKLLPAHGIPSLFVYFAIALIAYYAVFWYRFPVQTRAWVRLFKNAQ